MSTCIGIGMVFEANGQAQVSLPHLSNGIASNVDTLTPIIQYMADTPLQNPTRRFVIAYEADNPHIGEIMQAEEMDKKLQEFNKY